MDTIRFFHRIKRLSIAYSMHIETNLLRISYLLLPVLSAIAIYFSMHSLYLSLASLSRKASGNSALSKNVLKYSLMLIPLDSASFLILFFSFLSKRIVIEVLYCQSLPFSMLNYLQKSAKSQFYCVKENRLTLKACKTLENVSDRHRVDKLKHS